MIEAAIVLARILHYTASLVLFGALLFPLYTYPDRLLAPGTGTGRWSAKFAGWTALVALLTGVFWFGVVAISMTDGVLSGDAIAFVLTKTVFGEVSIARFLLTSVMLVLLVLQIRSHAVNWLLVALSAGLVASLAGLGHTQLQEGTNHLIHTIADGLHLLAAGAWLGGLVPLSYVVAKSLRTISADADAEARRAALRFSGMGYAAVATLIGSGLINSWFLVGTLTNLTSTPYGQVLLVKLVLFGGMLTLAVANRFVIVPNLTDVGSQAERAIGLAGLRRHVLAEQALGLFVIIAVGQLGAMKPAISLSP
jgi:putative copper resistance protein D